MVSFETFLLRKIAFTQDLFLRKLVYLNILIRLVYHLFDRLSHSFLFCKFELICPKQKVLVMYTVYDTAVRKLLLLISNMLFRNPDP